MSGDSVRVASPLFPVEGQGSIPMSPLQFEIVRMSLKDALALNTKWHSRLPYLPLNSIQRKHGIAFGCLFKNIYFAVAIWSTPASMWLDNGFAFELRRMAICNDAPKNTASRMLSIMVKIIKKETKYCRLLSYQDTEVHEGTIYKASGWEKTNTNKGKPGWFSPTGKKYSKNRSISKPIISNAPKIRWEKQIRPEPEAIIKPPKKIPQKGLFFHVVVKMEKG